MALVTILKLILTWGIFNVIFMIFGPAQFYLFKNSGWWANMPPDVLAYGDILYGLWIAQAIIGPAGIMIFAWREAHLKAASQG